MIPFKERQFLETFYRQTNGDFWINNQNWKDNKGNFSPYGTEDTWYGITIVNNHIHTIDMHSNKIFGAIPEEIGNLTYLEQLMLDNNKLINRIPASLANCRKLRAVFLDFNKLSGDVPEEITTLSNLNCLYLNNNSSLSCSSIHRSSFKKNIDLDTGDTKATTTRRNNNLNRSF